MYLWEDTGTMMPVSLAVMAVVLAIPVGFLAAVAEVWGGGFLYVQSLSSSSVLIPICGRDESGGDHSFGAVIGAYTGTRTAPRITEDRLRTGIGVCWPLLPLSLSLIQSLTLKGKEPQ
jgi:hypothetical protein